MTACTTLKPKAAGSGGGDSIDITSPVSAARVLVGETVVIDATEVGTSGNVDILLSLDNGATFPITIASDVALPQNWVPTSAQLAAQAVLRVRDAADALIVDDQSIVIATTSASGGGLTVEQGEMLEAIFAKTSLLTAGRRPQVISPVAAGGQINLTVGDDRVGDDSLQLDVADEGGVLHDLLTDAGVVSVVFGASLDLRSPSLIAGTITGIAYANDVTTITLAIAAADISTEAPIRDDYTYQIARVLTATDSDGKPLQSVEITGCLTLSRRRVAVVTA